MKKITCTHAGAYHGAVHAADNRICGKLATNR